MLISELKKVPVGRIMGLDCSTKSIAFAIINDGIPEAAGEITLAGANVFERLDDARAKTQAMVDNGVFNVNYIGIESAIMVASPQVAIKLAYVYGVVMGVLMQNRATVVEVAPITWQSYIGNPNLRPAEKAKFRVDFPGKSESWYKTYGRKFRKQRTMDIARQHFSIPTDSDNVSDAVGITLYLRDNLTTVKDKK